MLGGIFMQTCVNLESCGFMKKHGETKKLAIKGFIIMYCKGDKQNLCERKKYKQLYGSNPADEMMPNGSLLKA